MRELDNIYNFLNKTVGQKYLLLGQEEFSILKSVISKTSKHSKLNNFVIGEVDKKTYLSFGRAYIFLKDGKIKMGILSDKKHFFNIVGDFSLKSSRKPEEFIDNE